MTSHHEETWQPTWDVRTAITALQGFMETFYGEKERQNIRPFPRLCPTFLCFFLHGTLYTCHNSP